MLPVFETTRLSIEPIDLVGDLPFLLDLHNDKTTMQWIPNNKLPWTAADLLAKYAMNQSLYDKRIGMYKIQIKEASENITIGELGLFPCVDCTNTLELGYLLHQKYWKNGFATELLLALEQYSIQQLPYTTLRAQLFEQNENSKQLLERCAYRCIDAVALPTNQTKLIYAKVIQPSL